MVPFVGARVEARSVGPGAVEVPTTSKVVVAVVTTAVSVAVVVLSARVCRSLVEVATSVVDKVYFAIYFFSVVTFRRFYCTVSSLVDDIAAFDLMQTGLKGDVASASVSEPLDDLISFQDFRNCPLSFTSKDAQKTR